MKYSNRLTKHAAFLLILLPLTILFCQNVWAYPLPDTGQTKCYTYEWSTDSWSEGPCPQPGENYYGQDGNYLINPPSYTKLDSAGNDLPDSAASWVMVRDNVTGLIWEVKQNRDGTKNYADPHDADNTYTWYDSNPETNGGDAGTPGEGTDTEDFIAALNQANFGGHPDWRLPTIKELHSIVDYGSGPVINTGYFPWTVTKAVSNYWSSTTSADNTYYAWGVYFYNGSIGILDDGCSKSDGHYVRAVRGGQSGSFDHLVINGDGTVTDTASGLMWQQATESGNNWADAVSYCEDLSLAGYTDWRLPNANELPSIVEYRRSVGPVINTSAFPDAVSSYYWSSTTSAGNTNDAWRVNFGEGHEGADGKNDRADYVRAVRGGQNRLTGHLFVFSPKQGATWVGGETETITWETQGIAGNVSISISRQGGKSGTFDTIVESTENDGTFDWEVSGTKSVNCVIQITPIDDTTKGTTQGLFTISGSPTAVTGSATLGTSDSATLNGTVSPNGASTTVVFEWGTDDSYGNEVTATQSPLTGATDQSVSTGITGLNPGITYHFRVKAVNSLGTTYGSDQTFTTPAAAPSATTDAASAIAANSATLNGQVNPNGASTTVTFEYGLTTEYGNSVTAAESPLPNTANQGVSSDLTGLTSGQTYHYRVKAVNSVGTTYGSDQTFTTESTAPGAETGSASGLTSNSATLSGTINAHGDSTTVTFEYGTTDSYGSTTTAAESPLTGVADQSVSAEVTGLNLVTTYHYRVKAVNSYGTTYGDGKTFTTLAAAPSANTEPASSVTSTSAVLNGQVNPNGASTTVTFEYGLDTSYGDSLTATQSPVSGTVSQGVSAGLTSLTPGQTYHFRTKASNSVGTTYGSDQTFTASSTAPSASTGSATSITSSSAILNGSVNAHGKETTVTFEYGLDTSYGQTASASQSPVSGAADQAVTADISGLNLAATYHYRVKAVNGNGTTYGEDKTFTTSATAPTATTGSATSVTSNSATLNGTVNPSGASTAVTFEYGTTTSYGSTATATQSPLTGTTAQSVSAGLAGLAAETTYHFRVKTTNSVGTTYGNDLSFKTSVTPISVNLDNAKVVYVDENNILKKISDDGTVSSVLNTDAAVENILSTESGSLFIVFQSPQRFSDGYDYLLAKAVPVTNTISGIDTDLSSILWDVGNYGLSPGIQSDSSENLYYLATQSGKTVLKKCDPDGSNIVNLINDNIDINNWLVRADSTVLLGGTTTSTDSQWLRKLTPENNLSTLAIGSVQFLLDFPDDRVYSGMWSGEYLGVYKLPVSLTSFVANTPYIGSSMSSQTPEYEVQDIISGHGATYVSAFREYNGASIRQYIRTTNGRMIVLAASTSNTLVQYYPTPEIIELTLIDKPTIIAKMSHLLLIAGTKNGVNKLVLYDPETSSEISLLNDDIEIYHLASLYDGYVWLDGLKFDGNRYVVGKIQITINLQSSGTLYRAAVRSVGSFQEMATLSDKPHDLVGLSTSIAAVSAQVTSLYPVNNAQCGQTSTLWAQVQNTGSSALPSNATGWFYVDGPGWSGTNWVGSASVSGLSTGSTDWYSFDWLIPSGASAGTYTYWAQVWADTAISDWSSPQTFDVLCGGIPGKATLVSPSGTITDSTPAYSWNSVSGSTWYYLWVDDSTGTKIKQWYSADQAGCASGGTCSVTSSTVLADGAGQWWVQTWNGSGYGPWSDAMSFTLQ